MNIDEMQAGPDLDALVAEKVMGWTEVVSDGLYCWRDIEADEGTGKFARQENVAGYPVEDIEAWSASTDIAAAWQAIIKIKESHQVCFALEDYQFDGKHWQALFKGKFDEKLYYAFADTAYLAICRAALKAVLE